MSKINTIDRPTCRTISDEAEAALKAVAEKFGLTLIRSNGRFSPTNLTVKFDFQVTGDNGVSKKATQGAALLGLPEDCIGKQFKSGGRMFTITDINLRRRKYPVGGSGPQGGKYKFTVAQVMAGLL